ncbi:MAG: hypothetical protein LBU07_06675 [Coriobacteriales bacterium]|jgi:hypothetical protein|nr:hypothetical protein [Coriobacteriales bacterium]
MERKENDIAFWSMMVILTYMLIACIFCPLLLTGNAAYATVRLPLMILALILPFIHFFIFAGLEIAKGGKK